MAGVGRIITVVFLSTYNFISSWLSVVSGLPWVTVYKLFWFLCPVMLIAIGGWRLLATVLPKSSSWMRAMASLILATNTYVLMVTGGGQMGSVLCGIDFPMGAPLFLSIHAGY